jgi:transcriptional antiterminator NusG
MAEELEQAEQAGQAEQVEQAEEAEQAVQAEPVEQAVEAEQAVQPEQAVEQAEDAEQAAETEQAEQAVEAEQPVQAEQEVRPEKTVEQTEPQEQPPPVRNERFRWYILHAYSGFERKVRESIQSRVEAFGLKDRVGRVMIPTEQVTEIINGKKRTVERVFLPGYVLVEMELDNNLWHVLKDTPKVTGFLGTGDKPVALSEEEVSGILFRSEVAKEKPRLKIKFEKNEQVRITDGPFANFNGVVDEINEDRETLKVMVTIFGRSTPVEMEFGKVEKIE